MPKEKLPFIAPIGGGAGISRDGRLVSGVSGAGRALSLSDGRVAQPGGWWTGSGRQGAGMGAGGVRTGMLPAILLDSSRREDEQVGAWTPPPQAQGLFFPFSATFTGGLLDPLSGNGAYVFESGLWVEHFFLHDYGDYTYYPLRIECHAAGFTPDDLGGLFWTDATYFATLATAEFFATANNIELPAWTASTPFAYTTTPLALPYVQYSAVTAQGIVYVDSEFSPIPSSFAGWQYAPDGHVYLTITRVVHYEAYAAGSDITATTSWTFTEGTPQFPNKMTFRYELTIPANLCDTFTAELSWWLPSSSGFTRQEADHYTTENASYTTFEESVVEDSTRTVTATLPETLPSMLYASHLTVNSA